MIDKSPFSDEFKRDAVLQITERGYPVAEVGDRLGISKHSLYEWKKRFSKPVINFCLTQYFWTVRSNRGLTAR
jgi:transposase-like protein